VLRQVWRTRRIPRLTRNVFRDLAIFMVGLGLVTGLVFPPFVVVLGVPRDHAYSVSFRCACLVAGVLVGAVNHALARGVVGRRLRLLSARMRHVDGVVREATATGDWSGLDPDRCRIPIDSQDELSDTAAAFNRVLEALERDVAERQRLEQQLRHQALHDSLTGLANRRLLRDRVAQALSRVSRHGGQVAVLFIDLDGFKAVNDRLGHAAGDALLVAVAGRLLTGRRASDTVARLGGDEFAVLVEDVDADGATVVAERVVASLREPFVVAGQQVTVSASVGTALGPRASDLADDLLRDADMAMYMAKGAGKDRYRVFEDAMPPDAARRQEIGQEAGTSSEPRLVR
jgi:diguanylate cyclase (GGDEF)-like protein